jgi:hypothetical protein
MRREGFIQLTRSFWTLALTGLVSLISSLWSVPAKAENGCPPGSFPVGVQRGTENSGVYIPVCAPIPVAIPQQPLAPINHYAALAWHPDTENIWVTTRQRYSDVAKRNVLDSCAAIMGDGCEVVEQVNGFLGAAINPHGRIIWATDATKRGVNKSIDDYCTRYSLGCTPIGIFEASDRFVNNRFNFRARRNAQTVRHLYAAAAWTTDLAGFDGRSFVVSGRADIKEAIDAAVALCQESTNNSPCDHAAVTGDGVLIYFRDARGEVFWHAERNEARARQSAATACLPKNKGCEIHSIFDAHQSGTFQPKVRLGKD